MIITKYQRLPHEIGVQQLKALQPNLPDNTGNRLTFTRLVGLLLPVHNAHATTALFRVTYALVIELSMAQCKLIKHDIQGLHLVYKYKDLHLYIYKGISSTHVGH